MICQRCIKAAARSDASLAVRSHSFRQSRRHISASPVASSTPISPNTATQSTPRPAPPSSSHQPPAATSTSAAQPFSTPLTPHTRKAPKDKASRHPESSIPAGTPLKGLNLLKGKTDPLAMADEAYPPWLWTLLPSPSSASAKGSGEGEGDLYAKSANMRKKAARALRKREAAVGAGLETVAVPVEEQSVDLPGGDALGSAGRQGLRMNLGAEGARREVTKALRERRRAKIKETNFLKGIA